MYTFAPLYFLLISISSTIALTQNNNIYSWRPRPMYRPHIDRYDERFYFLRPSSEKVRMNWPEYHIRNAYDRDYIPPDFTSRAYYRELVHPDIGANPNMRYDNYLTSRLHDRDNFYRRPTRPIYYQNYPSYRNVEAVTRYNGRSERVRVSDYE